MAASGIVCLLTAWFTPAFGAASAVRVRGDTTCPTAAEVNAALFDLVAPPTAPAAPDVVDVIGRGNSVTIRLANAAGEPIAEKRLPLGLSCAERARTAAVMVAAWEVRLHPGMQPSLSVMNARSSYSIAMDLPPAESVLDAAATRSTGGLPGPELATRAPAAPVAAPARSAASAAAAVAVSPPRLTASDIELETSAAAMASLVAKDLAPAAMVEVRVARRGSALGLGIGAFAVDTHTTPVDPGRGAWRRFGGVIDLGAVSRWRLLEIEMRTGVAAAALAVTGQSFPATSSATLFDIGGLVALRLHFRVGRVYPWIDATTVAWPRTHGLYVNGSASSVDIPTFEVLLGAGVSLSLDP